MLNADYFRRIDALNFTMLHDDGQIAGGLDEADVVLMGVSRTSKTPTSIYLANRGIKTANVPIVPGVPLPAEVEHLKRPLAVGLIASPERIVQIRENRVLIAQRAPGFERLYRPPRRVRRDRPVAPPVRRARLAGDRRDAPLDRGDGGGDHGACSRSIAVPGSSKPERDGRRS